jgi:outer membrane protein assembly factor BamB
MVLDERYYLAVYGMMGDPYDLFCINRKSGKVVWKARPWANGGIVDAAHVILVGGTLSATGLHLVDMVHQGDRLLVFGSWKYGVSIECFNSNDGANLFRFSTSY